MRLVRFPESEPVSQALAHNWVQFARHGKPDWPAYTLAKRTTQIFNTPQSRPVNDPDHEVRTLLRNQ
jgi:carboxylesterase type B